MPEGNPPEITIESFRNKPEVNPFGFVVGQEREDAVMKHPYWYNKKGERVGFGDLSVRDLGKVMDGIGKGEAFYVLPSSDAFKAFTDRDREKRPTSFTDMGMDQVEFVGQRAQYLVFKGKEEGARSEAYTVGEPTYIEEEIGIKRISRQDAVELIKRLASESD